MKVIILILVIIATIHFVYDGILLPSIRMQLRNRLFALRDQARRHAIARSESLDKDAFDLIHNGINLFLNRLPQITISTAVRAQQMYEKQSSIRREVNKHSQIIDQCTDNELVDIFKQSNEILSFALIANTAGWFIYIIPIALFVLAFKKVLGLVKDITLMPRHLTESLMPLEPSMS